MTNESSHIAPSVKMTITPLRYVLSVMGGYLAISIPSLFAHSIWLDEAQALLIGRDSDSLGALYDHMRLEGHPLLWNLLLFVVTHTVTHTYAALQVLHLMICTTSVYLFVRYSPFRLPAKILIVFGYYLLFEYNLISRSYALGILLLFICCVLMSHPVKYRYWIGVVLFLMCNTHLLFAFAATGIFLYLAPVYGRRPRYLIPFALMYLAGLICLIIQIYAPATDPYNVQGIGRWMSHANFSFAASGLVKGWLPVPRINAERFWNTYWLDSTGPVFRGMLFVLLLILPALAIRRRRSALVFYYSSLALLLIFLVGSQRIGTRFYGLVFIYFLAACWMSGDTMRVEQLKGPGSRPVLAIGFYLVLIIQAGVGGYALLEDFRRPFSQSRSAIHYIQTHGLDRHAIVVDGYNAGPGLSAYLGRPVFYLDTDSIGSYCSWKPENFPIPRKTVASELIRSRYVKVLDSFVLITNRPVEKDRGYSEELLNNSLFRLQPLDSFTNAMVLSENYFVYQVKNKSSMYAEVRK